MLSDGDIRRIVARIVAGSAPLAVGTFGSYAIGRAHKGGDLNLYAIQHSNLPSPARRRKVMQCLYGMLHPLDVHVFTPAEIETGTREVLSCAWIIVRQARLYHWSWEAAVLVPPLTVRAQSSSCSR